MIGQALLESLAAVTRCPAWSCVVKKETRPAVEPLEVIQRVLLAELTTSWNTLPIQPPQSEA